MSGCELLVDAFIIIGLATLLLGLLFAAEKIVLVVEKWRGK